MTRPSSNQYHSERLAAHRRWARAYRDGRAVAVARHALGYGDVCEIAGSEPDAPRSITELASRRSPRRRPGAP